VEYITADGGKIPNLGEKSVNGLSAEGHKMAIRFQVASVSKPLISVAKLTAAGHKVTFGEDSGSIVNGTTGTETVFEKKDGVFVMRIWMPRSNATATPFTRQ
jgi:hypothetical protein